MDKFQNIHKINTVTEKELYDRVFQLVNERVISDKLSSARSLKQLDRLVS